jgi:hypothetical protein
MTRFKSQITNYKPQMNSKLQFQMAKKDFVWNFEFRSLEFVCYLACLREAASAEAGAWDLVLSSTTIQLLTSP